MKGLPGWRNVQRSCFVNPSPDGAYVAYTLCEETGA